MGHKAEFKIDEFMFKNIGELRLKKELAHAILDKMTEEDFNKIFISEIEKEKDFHGFENFIIKVKTKQ